MYARYCLFYLRHRALCLGCVLPAGMPLYPDNMGNGGTGGRGARGKGCAKPF